MKLVIEYLVDLSIYSICVILAMGGLQLLFDEKLNIGLLPIALISVPLTYLVRDVRSSPVMIINLGESKDDDHSKSN